MYTIQFYFGDEKRQAIVVTDIEAGFTLLEIALKHSIPLPHE
jgi:hypothetical protein